MTQRRLRQYTVPDGDRVLSFKGKLLGFASSESRFKPRWTEMSIYITEKGTYIIAGVGATRVKKGDVVEGVIAEKDETPRAWTFVCETAEGAIRHLYLHDENVRYMTRIAKIALGEAIQHDEALKKAYSVEEVA
jgi:hypothetical protein